MTPTTETKQGAPIRNVGATLRRLHKFLLPGPGESKPRRIRKVREIYVYSRPSQFFIDLVYRTLLNFGNWTTSTALGLRTGFLTFHASRTRFRVEAKMRPPIHVTDAQARKDIESLVIENKVVWDE